MPSICTSKFIIYRSFLTVYIRSDDDLLGSQTYMGVLMTHHNFASIDEELKNFVDVVPNSQTPFKSLILEKRHQF